jgi:hypothetical protein
MRCLLASLLLVVVGCVESGKPIRPARYFHDEPLFDIWAAEPQVGTVLLIDRHTSYGIDEILMARFEPSGDRGVYGLVAEEGDCRLYSARPSCGASCSWEEQCVGGVCVPFPVFVPVGDITIDGLGDRRTLVHDSLSPEMYAGDSDGTADGMMSSGATITVTAEGSDQLPGFTATASGVSALDSDIEPADILSLPRADDVELTWSGPEEGARVRLVFRTAEFDHYQISWEKLVCDAPDRGSIRVPGSLIEQLPEMTLPRDRSSGGANAGGEPAVASGLIRYRATDVDTGAGRVEVVAASEILFWALH